MTLPQHNEIVTLKAQLADTQASLQRWMDSHKKWEAYAASLEAQLQAHAQRTAPPQFQWEPSFGDPGWSPDGKHDYALARAERDRRDRMAQQFAEHQRTATNAA
jgi:hypothetical protein